MRRLRSRGRPSPALVVSLIALFVSISGIGYAAATIDTSDIKSGAVTASKLHRAAVKTKKIGNNAVNGRKVENHSLSGVDLKAPESYREIGSAGQPRFQNDAQNFGEGFSTAAFFIDHEGVVHLKGTVTAPTFAVIFTLPPGYRPSQQLFIPTVATSVASSILIKPTGEVQVRGGPGGTNNYALDGISFRAG